MASLVESTDQFRRADDMGNHGLANCLAQPGRLDQPIAEYRKALEINPNYAGAHFNLGKTLQRTG